MNDESLERELAELADPTPHGDPAAETMQIHKVTRRPATRRSTGDAKTKTARQAGGEDDARRTSTPPEPPHGRDAGKPAPHPGKPAPAPKPKPAKPAAAEPAPQPKPAKTTDGETTGSMPTVITGIRSIMGRPVPYATVPYATIRLALLALAMLLATGFAYALMCGQAVWTPVIILAVIVCVYEWNNVRLMEHEDAANALERDLHVTVTAIRPRMTWGRVECLTGDGGVRFVTYRLHGGRVTLVPSADDLL